MPPWQWGIEMKFLSLGLLLLCVAGCGGGFSGETVTGKVTLDGGVIEGAAITFQPVEGGTGMAAVGTADANGEFTLNDLRPESQGVAAGEYNIGIQWFKPSGPDLSQMTGESAGEDQGQDDKASHTGAPKANAALPVAYQTAKTSGLTFTVVAGDNDCQIELDSKFKGAK